MLCFALLCFAARKLSCRESNTNTFTVLLRNTHSMVPPSHTRISAMLCVWYSKRSTDGDGMVSYHHTSSTIHHTIKHIHTRSSILTRLRISRILRAVDFAGWTLRDIHTYDGRRWPLRRTHIYVGMEGANTTLLYHIHCPVYFVFYST